jgi:hypothetical protein
MTKSEIKLSKLNGIADEAMGVEIDRRIRQKYSLSNELAILRQRDKNPEEFAEYDAFAEQCKAEVKAEFDAVSI